MHGAGLTRTPRRDRTRLRGLRYRGMWIDGLVGTGNARSARPLLRARAAAILRTRLQLGRHAQRPVGSLGFVRSTGARHGKLRHRPTVSRRQIGRRSRPRRYGSDRKLCRLGSLGPHNNWRRSRGSDADYRGRDRSWPLWRRLHWRRGLGCGGRNRWSRGNRWGGDRFGRGWRRGNHYHSARGSLDVRNRSSKRVYL